MASKEEEKKEWKLPEMDRDCLSCLKADVCKWLFMEVMHLRDHPDETTKPFKPEDIGVRCKLYVSAMLKNLS